MPVYVVAILSEEASVDMTMHKNLKDQVIFDYTMIEKYSGLIAPRTISVIFTDTGNFKKDIKDCTDDVDRWFFLLKHSTRMREYSNPFQSEVFRRVLEVLEIGSFNQEEFNMYYKEEEQKKIRQAQDDTVRRLGREEGRAEANCETAKRMLARNMDIADISELTGLSVEEIQAL